MVNERQKQVLLRKVCRALGEPAHGADGGGLGTRLQGRDRRHAGEPGHPAGRRACWRAGPVSGCTIPRRRTRRAPIFGDRVAYAPDPYGAAEGADALVIVTEWLVYRNPDFERLKAALVRPLIVDGRNLYDPQRLPDALASSTTASARRVS